MSSSIKDAWQQIVSWLESNAPSALEDVQGPATAAEIDEAAKQMEAEFPPELRAFFETVNGADSCGIFPSNDDFDEMAYSPMALEQVIQDWETQKELLEMGDFSDLEPKSDPGVADDWWNTGWIPFASNGGGDCFCVDLSPTDSGKLGQVISHSHETGEHVVLAESLTEFLQQLVSRLEANEMEYDEDYGLRKMESDE
ncbi:MAG: SMI1/KNR4 family protein [Pirellulaceae bacterium]